MEFQLLDFEFSLELRYHLFNEILGALNFLLDINCSCPCNKWQNGVDNRVEAFCFAKCEDAQEHKYHSKDQEDHDSVSVDGKIL